MKRMRAKAQHIFSFASTFFLVFILPFAFGKTAPQSAGQPGSADMLNIAHAEAPGACGGCDGGGCCAGGGGGGCAGGGGGGGGGGDGGACCGCDGCGAGCASGCCC